MRIENKSFNGLPEIVRENELILLDSNVVIGDEADDLKQALRIPIAHKLDYLDFEFLESLRGEYRLVRRLIARNPHIRTVSGVPGELSGLLTGYQKPFRKLWQNEGKRMPGSKQQRNQWKLEIIRDAYRQLHHIIKCLDWRLCLSEEKLGTAQFGSYVQSFNGKAGGIDVSLVTTAMQLARNGRNVGLISSDGEIVRLAKEACEGLYGFMEGYEKSRITLYSYVRGIGYCAEAEARIPIKIKPVSFAYQKQG